MAENPIADALEDVDGALGRADRTMQLLLMLVGSLGSVDEVQLVDHAASLVADDLDQVRRVFDQAKKVAERQAGQASNAEPAGYDAEKVVGDILQASTRRRDAARYAGCLP